MWLLGKVALRCRQALNYEPKQQGASIFINFSVTLWPTWVICADQKRSVLAAWPRKHNRRSGQPWFLMLLTLPAALCRWGVKCPLCSVDRAPLAIKKILERAHSTYVCWLINDVSCINLVHHKMWTKVEIQRGWAEDEINTVTFLFVNGAKILSFFPPKFCPGLVHKTHMSSCRVDKPSEMVDVGDKVWVKVIGKEVTLIPASLVLCR